jgi:hypothetical protein
MPTDFSFGEDPARAKKRDLCVRAATHELFVKMFGLSAISSFAVIGLHKSGRNACAHTPLLSTHLLPLCGCVFSSCREGVEFSLESDGCSARVHVVRRLQGRARAGRLQLQPTTIPTAFLN